MAKLNKVVVEEERPVRFATWETKDVSYIKPYNI